MSKKLLKGEVVSTKMEKTLVVKVPSAKKDKRYGKTYILHKKYKAFYDGTDIKEGDMVTIEECAPISKSKSWIVVKKK